MSNFVIECQIGEVTDAGCERDAAVRRAGGSIEILMAEKEAELLREFTHLEKVQALEVPS